VLKKRFTKERATALINDTINKLKGFMSANPLASRIASPYARAFSIFQLKKT
jgi:hypothetical protein